MADLPDVSDPDIRQMVLRNHEPEEMWIGNFATGDRIVSVYCRTCWSSWPCPAVQAAREADDPTAPS